MSILPFINLLRSTCNPPRRRSSLRRLCQGTDGLEPRQLMTALIDGYLERESNNTTAKANDLELTTEPATAEIGTYFGGAIGGSDSQDFFRLTLQQNVTNASFTLTEMTGNLNLQVRNSAGRVLASGLKSGTADELVTLGSLSAGTYYVRVFRATVSVRSSYAAVFDATLPAPPRPASGDVEPNNTSEGARSVGVLLPGVATVVAGQLGQLNSSGDRDVVDYYRVPVGMNGNLQLNLSGSASSYYLSVYDRDGNLLTIVDDGTMTLTGLAAGDYFIKVSEFDAVSSYWLSTTLTAGGPVSFSDVGSNDTQATAVSLGKVNSSQNFVGVGKLTRGDVDWYRFETTATWNGSMNFAGAADSDNPRQLTAMPAGTYYAKVQTNSYVGMEATLYLWDPVTSATIEQMTGYSFGQYYRLSGTITYETTPPTPPTPQTGDVEPNDSRTAAAVLASLTPGVSVSVSGRLTGSDLEDWYRVYVGASGSLQVDLTGLSADLDMQVQNTFGNMLGESKNTLSSSERVILSGLASGDYFIRITRHRSAASDYQLSAVSSGTVIPDSLDLEPNNIRSQASNLGSAPSGVPVVIDGTLTAGDTDWYRFEAMSRWNGSLTLSVTGSSPAQQSVSELGAGTWYLRVQSNLLGLSAALLNSSGVEVQRLQLYAGGNTYRLNAMLQHIESPPVVIGRDSEPNDTRSMASPFGTMRSGAATSVTGSLVPAEADDWFEFSLSEASTLSVNLSLSNARSRLLNRCDHSTHIQVVNSRGFVLADTTPPFTNVNRGGTRTLNLSSLPAGRYYLRVFRTQTGLASPYTLTATPQR